MTDKEYEERLGSFIAYFGGSVVVVSSLIESAGGNGDIGLLLGALVGIKVWRTLRMSIA